MTVEMMRKAQALVNSLDFEGLVDALEKVDNIEMIAMIIERMFVLDEERAIAFADEY